MQEVRTETPAVSSVPLTMSGMPDQVESKAAQTIRIQRSIKNPDKIRISLNPRGDADWQSITMAEVSPEALIVAIIRESDFNPTQIGNILGHLVGEHLTSLMIMMIQKKAISSEQRGELLAALTAR